MKDNLTLQLILDEVSARLVHTHETDKFLKNFTGGDDAEKANPVYAFKWAEGAIEESVKRLELMRLANYAEHQLGEVGAGNTTEELALANIVGHYQREVIRRAGDVPSSTSTLSNMIENYERKTSAAIYSWLEGEYFSGL